MNAKKKGNHGEHLFAQWLQSHGIKAYKNSSSGGNEWKSDIHNDIGINFEVKTCKKINLKKCWYQTNRDSSLAKSIPMLAVHFDGMPEKEWLMVLHSEDWVDMILKSRQTSPNSAVSGIKSSSANQSLKYKTQTAISHLKALIKELENANE